MQSRDHLLTRAGFVVAAFLCLPLLGADNDPVTKKPVPEATDKSTRLMGRVVDLHDFMTRGKPVLVSGATDASPTPSAEKGDARLENPKAADAIGGGSPAAALSIYALDTLNDGLVILHFKDPPVLLFLPSVPGQAKPDDPDGTQARRLKISDSGPEYWVGKQVRLSGTLYERNRVKYFVVDHVLKSQDDVPAVRSLPVPHK